MKAADLQLTDGASAGAWIKPGLGGEFGAVTLQVPKDFDAYARIFHPALDSEWSPVTWAEIAKSCGATAHHEMQWHAIAGIPSYDDLEASKWPGEGPSTGAMDLSTLDALCEILTTYTADPTHCLFGLCVIERWEDAFSKAELRAHRLLELPMGRDHIVLEGPLSAVDQIVDERSERASFKPARSSPNLVWPADHSWLVVSEVDFDSTLVGGSTELIEAIVVSSTLEAWRVEPTTSLAEDADKINAL